MRSRIRKARGGRRVSLRSLAAGGQNVTMLMTSSEHFFSAGLSLTVSNEVLLTPGEGLLLF